MLLHIWGVRGFARKRKLSKIYSKYHNLLFHAARKITGNNPDAEDAVQDAFLRIIRLLDKIEDVDSDRTKVFVLAIVESRAIDICRKRRRWGEVPFDDEWMAAKEDHGEAVARQDALGRALDGLSEEGRRALILKYDGGLTVEEIAELFGKTTKTTYKTIERAKNKLAENLKKEGVDIEW